MDKGLDKNTALNVYEVKSIKREFNNKISAADVFNEFLYLGDEKGIGGCMKVMSIRIPFVQMIPR